VNSILDDLTRLHFEPRLVPHGRIDELRGGISCMELRAEGIDAAVVLSTMSYGSDVDSKGLYKIDYAVRGNIRGALPGRIITRATYGTKGMLKRRIERVGWEVPQTESAPPSAYRLPLAEGVHPGPGEVWKGGPHEELNRCLNRDAELVQSIRSFMDSKKWAPMDLSVVSDAWNESLRITGGLWLKASELGSVYTSPEYARIVEKVGQHVKGIRRRFGGLTL
jgi:hypothetical protein